MNSYVRTHTSGIENGYSTTSPEAWILVPSSCILTGTTRWRLAQRELEQPEPASKVRYAAKAKHAFRICIHV